MADRPPSPSSGVTRADIERAEAWLLPVWRDLPGSTYTPTSMKLAALIAAIRNETIEACAARAAGILPPFDSGTYVAECILEMRSKG